MLLTNADLDHTLGLVSLREEPRLTLYATEATREVISHSIAPLLSSFSQVHWHDVLPGAVTPLPGSHLTFRAIFLPGTPPPYSRLQNPQPVGHSIAYEFFDCATGGRLVAAPDVAEVTPELHVALAEANAVLFDGTFWSDEELAPIRPGARRGREMGHLPIADGSLALLRSLASKHKSYFHINNTNPILDPRAPERAQVTEAGLEVAEDGTEWIL